MLELDTTSAPPCQPLFMLQCIVSELKTRQPDGAMGMGGHAASHLVILVTYSGSQPARMLCSGLVAVVVGYVNATVAGDCSGIS